MRSSAKRGLPAWLAAAGGVLGLFCLAPAASADRWGPPERLRALSPSGRFEARVQPTGESGARLRVWRRTLPRPSLGYDVRVVNERSPVSLAVSEAGHVLTLDEWGALGHEHAMVLYAPDGRVLKDYTLEDFLSASELEDKVMYTVSSRRWLHLTESVQADDKAFRLSTRWGEGLIVSLADGAVERELQPFARLRDYLAGRRRFGRAEIRVVHVVKTEDGYDAFTCVLSPRGGRCHKSAEGFGLPAQTRDFPFDAGAFCTLLASSGALLPHATGTWSVQWGSGLVQVEMAFAGARGQADEYRFLVDTCAAPDPAVRDVVGQLMRLTGMDQRVHCLPGD
jgi:hypothetical protein